MVLDVESLLGPVQTALVPVVLSSTGGLLCLLVQTRYGRIIDRTRELLKLDYDPDVDMSLEMLFKRARYAKWSLFGLFFGISSFLTLSLIILVSILFPTTLQPGLIVIVFLIGMSSMLIGVWYEVLELWASFSGLGLEYSRYRQKTKQ
jgi:cellulose synthase/poly-beta-1,6-N-acetylglucosamine synthase-like glycosyltransferase